MLATSYINVSVQIKVSLEVFIGWLAVSLVDLGRVWLSVFIWCAKLALSIGIEVWHSK